MPETDLTLFSDDELVEEIRQRFPGVNLMFPGKFIAAQVGRKVRPYVQRPIAAYSGGDEEGRSNNFLIEGENLYALASLYKWRGLVNLILTDPPYNTGNDFRYNDKWNEDPNDPALGEVVASDDPAKHTKWMQFMYPRIQMMRAMLAPTGVMAICIDHRELFHLGQMMDEIFGEENRLALINWEKSYAPKSNDSHISTATEYVLVYARDKDRAQTGLFERGTASESTYKNPDNDPRGRWYADNYTGMGASTHPGQVYGIQSPFSGEILYPGGERCWATERRKLKANLQAWGTLYEDLELDDGKPSKALVLKGWRPDLGAKERTAVLAEARAKAEAIRDGSVMPGLVFLRNGFGGPRKKSYLEEIKKGVVPLTYWAGDEHQLSVELGATSWDHEESGHSQSGITELNAIVGRGHGFETVKPMKLVQKIIQLWCPSDGLVLDPFAGSGTIGHATLALNSIQGSDRRFILIEQGRPEKRDTYAKTLTSERLKRAISGEWANGKGKPLGGGFTFSSLTKKIDAPTLLLMERDEMVDTVISSHFDSNRRRGSNLRRFPPTDGYKYLVARNGDNEGVYLIWGGAGQNANLTEDAYEAIVAEGVRASLESKYHVYSHLNLFVTDDVRWYQIPDRILQDFGLDVRIDAYNEPE
jgi:adenine-specific DNA-methyltransferase